MSGHSTRFARAASFIAIVAGIGFASEANAASFDVKIGTDFPLDPAEYGNCKCVSTAPSKDCTIRAAIQASNMCSQPVDVIKLDDILPAVYRLSISGAGDDTGTIGDWDVFRDTANGGTTGSKTVYLNLNGQIITPDAGVVDRFFDIPATETQLTLNISAGRLQNAQTAWPEKGGCLRARAGKLTLSSMVFQNCRAYHSGGAVEVSDVTLEVTNSNFGGNGFNVPLTYPHNPTGGALAARDSTVTIEGSGFVDNSAQTGGGIFVAANQVAGAFQGSLTMAESDVSSNIVNGDGGGLALFAPFAIADSTIIGNTAADSVSLGAGLYIEVEDSVSIEDSYVEENWAVLRGGGLHVEGGPRSLLRST